MSHLRHLPWHRAGVVPLDIDTHPIAARPDKGERDHDHHDFLYVVLGDSSQAATAQESEVHAARWASVDEMEELGSRLRRAREKLRALHLVA